MITPTTMTDVDTRTEAMERMCTAMRLELPPSVADHIQARIRALAAERDELERLAVALKDAGRALHTAILSHHHYGAGDHCRMCRKPYRDEIHLRAAETQGDRQANAIIEFETALNALTAYQRKNNGEGNGEEHL